MTKLVGRNYLLIYYIHIRLLLKTLKDINWRNVVYGYVQAYQEDFKGKDKTRGIK